MSSNLKIQESNSEKYTPRTYFNAKSADLTIALAVNLSTAGELLTHKAAGDKYIGFKLDDNSDTKEIAEKILERIKEKNVKTLNIAGNGIYTLSKYGCDQSFINYFVYHVLNHVCENTEIKHIFTGGQTGVDLAGAVFAKYKGVNATITLPKGYIQRFEDKIDRKHTKEEIETQIDFWCADLDKKLKQVKIHKL